MEITEALTEKFWQRVAKGPGCWEWQGAIAGGYGNFYVGNHTQYVRAHRYSWTLANGPIPDGHGVFHHCDNKRCVRPDHLFVGVAQDNLTDLVKKRRARGEKFGSMRVKGKTCLELKVYAGLDSSGKRHYLYDFLKITATEEEIEAKFAVLRFLADAYADERRAERTV